LRNAFPNLGDRDATDQQNKSVGGYATPKNARTTSVATVLIKCERHAMGKETIKTADGSRKVEGIGDTEQRCDGEHAGRIFPRFIAIRHAGNTFLPCLIISPVLSASLAVLAVAMGALGEALTYQRYCPELSHAFIASSNDLK
jgi:hypothetical protein